MKNHIVKAFLILIAVTSFSTPVFATPEESLGDAKIRLEAAIEEETEIKTVHEENRVLLTDEIKQINDELTITNNEITELQNTIDTIDSTYHQAADIYNLLLERYSPGALSYEDNPELLEEMKNMTDLEAQSYVSGLKLDLETNNNKMSELENEKEFFETLLISKKSSLDEEITLISESDQKISQYEQELDAKIEEIRKESEEILKENPKTEDITVPGDGFGTDIALFALQFVGNPYVSGGTSLTNGADCSGFTMSVYKNFGIDIPRTSGAQASSGTTVSEEEMLPGDIVCYDGHVGIYIGNDQIVHASTEATGIKVGNMHYKTIKCVKRYY